MGAVFFVTLANWGRQPAKPAGFCFAGRSTTLIGILSRDPFPQIHQIWYHNPVKVYENWRRQREEFFGLIREMQAEADLEPDEADRLAAEAVTAVRADAKQGR